MEQRNLYYFVSDVHLGLDYLDPVARERKFADFLLQLPSHTKKLFLSDGDPDRPGYGAELPAVRVPQ